LQLPFIPPDSEFVLAGAGEMKLGDHWLLQAELLSPNALPPTWKDNPFEAWLDAEKVQFPLRVRTWKPGDRFRPLGMKRGSVKIADFLSERKIPRPQRLNYAVVFSGSQVMWLPGLQIADQFRLIQNTRQLLHLKLSRF
jgi:tRNA(Ile)-lysidine synthase